MKINESTKIVMRQTLTAAIDQWWEGISENDGIGLSALPIIGRDTFSFMAQSAVLILESMSESQQYAIDNGYLHEDK